MLRKIVKLVAIIAISITVFSSAYRQGVQHAIATASTYANGESILIDFDGQVHEYK